MRHFEQFSNIMRTRNETWTICSLAKMCIEPPPHISNHEICKKYQTLARRCLRKKCLANYRPDSNKIPVWHFSPKALPRDWHTASSRFVQHVLVWCIHFWAMFHCCKYPSSSTSMSRKSLAFHYAIYD